MTSRGRMAFASVSLLCLFVASLSSAEDKLPAPAVNALGPSPARLVFRFAPGARIYYSLDGSYPTEAYDPANPPLLYDTTKVCIVARRDGYIDSDVVSREIIVRHVLAIGGRPGQLTSKGNNYSLTLRKVIGNGKGQNDNTQIRIVIAYTGTLSMDWTGKAGDIQLTDAKTTDNLVTLTFGDGKSTLFSQKGPNPTGIYDFNIKIGRVDLIVYVPYVFLPQWINPSP
jgi:hypothetical protein